MLFLAPCLLRLSHLAVAGEEQEALSEDRLEIPVISEAFDCRLVVECNALLFDLQARTATGKMTNVSCKRRCIRYAFQYCTLRVDVFFAQREISSVGSALREICCALRRLVF
jgi:hypothetical protein